MARLRHRFQMHATAQAPHTPQAALDEALLGAEIEVPPALEPAVMDLKLPAGLPAAATYPPPTPEPHGHDHPLHGEAHIDHGRAGEAQKPVEWGRDAHLALLAGR